MRQSDVFFIAETTNFIINGSCCYLGGDACLNWRRGLKRTFPARFLRRVLFITVSVIDTVAVDRLFDSFPKLLTCLATIASLSIDVAVVRLDNLLRVCGLLLLCVVLEEVVVLRLDLAIFADLFE